MVSSNLIHFSGNLFAKMVATTRRKGPSSIKNILAGPIGLLW